MATCVGGTVAPQTQVSVADTPCVNLTLTAAGVLSADPIVAPECNGLECTATGLAVIPSSDLGNNLACGTDGRLFVPTGAATVTTGPCGVSGTGTVADPVVAKVAAWPFPCAQDGADGATGIYCSPTTGQLQGPPRARSVTPVPAGGLCQPGPGFGNATAAASITITAPPCQDLVATVFIETTADVDSPGLVNFAVEYDVNGGGFNTIGTGFIPGAEGSGGTVRSNHGYTTVDFRTIPAGTSTTLSVRFRLSEVIAGGNVWNSSCVGLNAIASTV